LPLTSRGSEVSAELIKDQGRRRRALLRSAGGRRLLALITGKQLDDLLAHPVEVGTQLDQDLSGDTFALADQTQQDVLGPDVVVAELQCLPQRELEDLLRARGEGNVTAGCLLALADDLLDLLAHRFQGDAEGLQRLGGDAFTLVDEAEQDVLGPDVVVVEHARFFLRENHHSAGSVGKPLEHPATPHRSGDFVPGIPGRTILLHDRRTRDHGRPLGRTPTAKRLGNTQYGTIQPRGDCQR